MTGRPAGPGGMAASGPQPRSTQPVPRGLINLIKETGLGVTYSLWPVRRPQLKPTVHGRVLWCVVCAVCCAVLHCPQRHKVVRTKLEAARERAWALGSSKPTPKGVDAMEAAGFGEEGEQEGAGGEGSRGEHENYGEYDEGVYKEGDEGEEMVGGVGV